MSKDLLEQLADLARERRAPVDPRWEALARGELTEAERAALLAEEDAARLAPLFEPLGDTFADALTARLLGGAEVGAAVGSEVAAAVGSEVAAELAAEPPSEGVAEAVLAEAPPVQAFEVPPVEAPPVAAAVAPTEAAVPPTVAEAPTEADVPPTGAEAAATEPPPVEAPGAEPSVADAPPDADAPPVEAAPAPHAPVSPKGAPRAPVDPTAEPEPRVELSPAFPGPVEKPEDPWEPDEPTAPMMPPPPERQFGHPAAEMTLIPALELKPAPEPARAEPVDEAEVVPLRPRRWLYAAPLLALAAAALLFVGIGRGPATLPAYALEVQGGEQVARAGDVVAKGPLKLSPGSRVTIVARPAEAVEGRVAAEARVRAGEGAPQPWTGPVEVSDSGAVRLSGTLGADLKLPPGASTIEIAVRPEADAKADARVLTVPILVVE